MQSIEHLENVVNFHYKKVINEAVLDNDKANFYSAIKDLARMILVNKYDVDSVEDSAHDYATSLFERVVINGDRLGSGDNRIPFTQYITLNIKSLIYGYSNSSDIQHLYDDVKETSYESKNYIAGKLYDLLSVYYSSEEIKRKLPICLDLICETSSQPLARTLPKDLRAFGVTLVCLAKRLASRERTEVNENIDTVEQALRAGFRSSLFLGLLADNPSYAPIFMSLDIDSLFRLASISGGQRITVPSMQYINSLINGTVVATKLIGENKDVDEVDYKFLSALDNEFKIRTDSDKTVSLPSLQKTVSRALDVYKASECDIPSSSLLGSMTASLTAVSKLLDSVDPDVSAKTLVTFIDNHQAVIDKLKRKLNVL